MSRGAEIDESPQCCLRLNRTRRRCFEVGQKSLQTPTLAYFVQSLFSSQSYFTVAVAGDSAQLCRCWPPALAETANRPRRRHRDGSIDVVQQRDQGIESMLTERHKALLNRLYPRSPQSTVLLKANYRRQR